VPPPRICSTPAPTPTRVVVIARPQGRFTSCGTIVFAIVGRPVRLPDLNLVLPPQPAAPPTVTVASRPTLVDAGTVRVDHASGLSLCVPSRRTWWHLPRLCYLGDEEYKSEIFDNQSP
jgi:hypothetical protein